MSTKLTVPSQSLVLDIEGKAYIAPFSMSLISSLRPEDSYVLIKDGRGETVRELRPTLDDVIQEATVPALVERGKMYVALLETEWATGLGAMSGVSGPRPTPHKQGWRHEPFMTIILVLGIVCFGIFMNTQWHRDSHYNHDMETATLRSEIINIAMREEVYRGEHNDAVATMSDLKRKFPGIFRDNVQSRIDDLGKGLYLITSTAGHQSCSYLVGGSASNLTCKDE